MTKSSGSVPISVNALRYSVLDKAILQGISVDVRHRRIGIIGRNGSGKSTFARILAGLIKPDNGQVFINGVDVASDRKAALRTVGILFQNPDHQIIFPTVEEEIAFGLRQLGQNKAQIKEGVHAVLDRFGKSAWAEVPVQHLSQGQRQLLCLMSVFAMAPKVILLDEPFSGLDIPLRLQLARHIAGLPSTVLHISHDPTALAEYDHIIWLEAGRIVAQGEADLILPQFVAAMEELGMGDDITYIPG